MHWVEQSFAGSNNGYFLEAHWVCSQSQGNCSASACSFVLRWVLFLEVTCFLVLLDTHLKNVNNQEYVIFHYLYSTTHYVQFRLKMAEVSNKTCLLNLRVLFFPLN